MKTPQNTNFAMRLVDVDWSVSRVLASSECDDIPAALRRSNTTHTPQSNDDDASAPKTPPHAKTTTTLVLTLDGNRRETIELSLDELRALRHAVDQARDSLAAAT